MRHPRGSLFSFFFICAKFIFKIIASVLNKNIKTVAEKGESAHTVVLGVAREGEGEGCRPYLRLPVLLRDTSFVPQIGVCRLQTANYTIIILSLSSHNEIITVLSPVPPIPFDPPPNPPQNAAKIWSYFRRMWNINWMSTAITDFSHDLRLAPLAEGWFCFLKVNRTVCFWEWGGGGGGAFRLFFLTWIGLIFVELI